MLVILLVAFIASPKFAKAASAKGTDPRQAARYPWISGLIVLVAGFLLSLLLNAVLYYTHASPNFLGFFSWVWNLFVLGVYFALLSRAWKSLKALPDRKPGKAD
ncbi:hypothetical protein [Luteolibacter sp. LG18]|uniref:hypothetical protein n=1 Tax=Luteolibacter sp. LG18 TaxID=2819286 RepID=UPI002B28A6A3|nr:hypothetical protein llg_24520 [Luteolibacter sp. LG18]